MPFHRRTPAVVITNPLTSSAEEEARYAKLLYCYSGSLAGIREVHALFIAQGQDCRPFLANRLILAYGQRADLPSARAVFNRILHRTAVSWNFLIAAYAKHGHPLDSLRVFRLMSLDARVIPDKFTFLPLISACVHLGSLADARRVAAAAVVHGACDLTLCNALIHMFGECGSPADAHAVFASMHRRDVVSWTAMIAAFSRNSLCEDALTLFCEMDTEPDKTTYLCALHACSHLPCLKTGRAIHKRVSAGKYAPDLAIKNALISMYGKCCTLKDAWAIFDEIEQKDIISWNAMIQACAENGHNKDAIDLFRRMKLEGISITRPTLLGILRSCNTPSALVHGREIHCQDIVAGRFASDPAVQNALVNMYAKCGSLAEAKAVFDQMCTRSVISWSAMIVAYLQSGLCEEALNLFRSMVSEGVQPDRIMFLGILDSCADKASLKNGKAAHEHIIACGFDADIPLCTALINMYGKCGSLIDARVVFDQMQHRDTICWNAMIAAFARNGDQCEVFELFQRMVSGGVKPDGITFLHILYACSSAGLIEEGRAYFMLMALDYDIAPTVEHCTCLMGLLGRQAGCAVEVEELMKNMPARSDVVAWTTLFDARKLENGLRE